MNENEPRPSVQMVEVPANAVGQRIDNYLLGQLKGVPKSLVYRILRKGEVRVNRGRIKPDYRLQSGDLVRIPPVRQTDRSGLAQPPPGLTRRLLEAVIFDEAGVFAINKPSGVAVHKGSGVDFGVIEALRANREQEQYLELAHRLDRETSGCLVLAKSSPALREIQNALVAGGVEKRYLALVRGQWNLGRHTETAPLRKNVLRGGERQVEVDPDGKPCVTHFKPLTITPRATLLEVRLGTGRTHQIRVHVKHLGFPLAGDSKYGDSEFNREMSQFGLKRLFLHAQHIGFSLGGRDISIDAPLADDLRLCLDRMEETL